MFAILNMVWKREDLINLMCIQRLGSPTNFHSSISVTHASEAACENGPGRHGSEDNGGHEVMILILFEKIGTICWLTGHALLRDVIGLFPHQLGCLGYRPYLYGSINPSLKQVQPTPFRGWRKRGYGTAIYRKTTIPWRTHPSAPWMMKMWMFTLLSMISRVSSVTFCVLAALELALVV